MICGLSKEAPKLQVAHYLSSFEKKKKRDIILIVLSVYIYLLFPTLTMCLVPYFVQLSFV